MTEFRRLLKTLVDHEVDFIVGHGLAAVLHGAPITTNDVDILFRSRRRILTVY